MRPRKFNLYVTTDKDELIRILRDVANKLESGADDFGMYRTLSDSHGNDVGRAKLFTQEWD